MDCMPQGSARSTFTGAQGIEWGILHDSMHAGAPSLVSINMPAHAHDSA